MTLRDASRVGIGLILLSCTAEMVDEEPNLEQSYAGLTATDEDPLFGEAEVYEAIGEDGEDPLVVEPPTLESPAYHVAILWGHLRPRPLAENVLDWSGVVTVEDGRVRVLRTIRFDREDRLLDREDESTVAYISHTRPHHDGLALRVEAAEGAMLTLSSTSYTGDFELAEGVTIVPVDEEGNAVAVAIVRAGPGICARGIMGGRWHSLEERRGFGLFRGRWLAADGELNGFLRGVYGVRKNGEQVFFGKAIEAGGRMIGLLAGRYGDGMFRGRYLGREMETVGALHGRYIEAIPGDEQGGFFLGTWRVYCNGEGPSADEPAVE